MLDPTFYWMPGVKRDIGRCLDFAVRQPPSNPDEWKSEFQRGMAMICANPGSNPPEIKLVHPRWRLRRYGTGHTLIVYAYLRSRDPRSPSIVVVVAVRYVRQACESETGVIGPLTESDETDDPGNWDCITDPDDDIDWDEVVAAIEEDEDSEELAFNSADYPTEEAAMHALRAFIHEIFEEAERDAALDPALDASGQTGHRKGDQFHSSADLGKAAGS
jgi:hypothetical protein